MATKELNQKPVESLKGLENYLSWKYQMELRLDRYEILEYVTGVIKEPIKLYLINISTDEAILAGWRLDQPEVDVNITPSASQRSTWLKNTREANKAL